MRYIGAYIFITNGCRSILIRYWIVNFSKSKAFDAWWGPPPSHINLAQDNITSKMRPWCMHTCYSKPLFSEWIKLHNVICYQRPLMGKQWILWCIGPSNHQKLTIDTNTWKSIVLPVRTAPLYLWQRMPSISFGIISNPVVARTFGQNKQPVSTPSLSSFVVRIVWAADHISASLWYSFKQSMVPMGNLCQTSQCQVIWQPRNYCLVYRLPTLQDSEMVSTRKLNRVTNESFKH